MNKFKRVERIIEGKIIEIEIGHINGEYLQKAALIDILK